MNDRILFFEPILSSENQILGFLALEPLQKRLVAANISPADLIDLINSCTISWSGWWGVLIDETSQSPLLKPIQNLINDAVAVAEQLNVEVHVPQRLAVDEHLRHALGKQKWDVGHRFHFEWRADDD